MHHDRLYNQLRHVSLLKPYSPDPGVRAGMNEYHDDEGIHPLDTDYAVRDTVIPGWWVWQSPVNHLWHARKKGTDSIVLAHGNDVDDLRESVEAVT
jgi:hypothetical protein